VHTITTTQQEESKPTTDTQLTVVDTEIADASLPPTIEEITDFVSDFTDTLHIGSLVEHFSRAWIGEGIHISTL
jgi:hypothetical protein